MSGNPQLPAIESEPLGVRVLETLARQGLMSGVQLSRLLGVEQDAADDSLAGLCRGGLARLAPRLRDESEAYLITRRGLASIESALPPPRVDLRCYRRDLGVGWLLVEAQQGVFGELDGVFTRREMCWRDQVSGGPVVEPAWPAEVRAKAVDAGFGTRPVGAAGGAGCELFYPDLMLVIPQGRVAMELVFAPPGAVRLEGRLRAYVARPSIAVVVLFVEDAATGSAVTAVAERPELAEKVMVQRFLSERTPTAKAAGSGRAG